MEKQIYQNLTVCGTAGWKRVKALIDTGASHCIINGKLAREIKPMMLDNKATTIELGGNKFTEGKLATIRLKIQKTVVEQSVYIIESESNGCILGTDFLQKHNAIIDYRTDKIRI